MVGIVEPSVAGHIFELYTILVWEVLKPHLKVLDLTFQETVLNRKVFKIGIRKFLLLRC